MGRLFGPITTLWLVTLALLGIINIAEQPGGFEAVSPLPGITFFAAQLGVAFLSLGALFSG